MAKLESAHFFKVQSGKLTVWRVWAPSKCLPKHLFDHILDFQWFFFLFQVSLFWDENRKYVVALDIWCIWWWWRRASKLEREKISTRINATCKSCHVTYQLEISSTHLITASCPSIREPVLNLVLWLVGQHQVHKKYVKYLQLIWWWLICHKVLWLVSQKKIHKGKFKLIGHVTSLILCKDSSYKPHTPCDRAKIPDEISIRKSN